MKKLFLGALFLTLFAASNAYGQGANSASATANGKARVVNPITLAVAGTSELNFGDLVPSTSSAGAVVLTPAAVRTAGGGVTLGSGSAAAFRPSTSAGRRTPRTQSPSLRPPPLSPRARTR